MPLLPPWGRRLVSRGHDVGSLLAGPAVGHAAAPLAADVLELLTASDVSPACRRLPLLGASLPVGGGAGERTRTVRWTPALVEHGPAAWAPATGGDAEAALVAAHAWEHERDPPAAAPVAVLPDGMVVARDVDALAEAASAAALTPAAQPAERPHSSPVRRPTGSARAGHRG